MNNPPVYAELVPLTEATAAAYHALVVPKRSALQQAEIEKRRTELTLALAALVPVYIAEEEYKRPVTMAELESTIKSRPVPPSALSRLYVRRLDLSKALEVLQAAIHRDN